MKKQHAPVDGKPPKSHNCNFLATAHKYTSICCISFALYSAILSRWRGSLSMYKLVFADLGFSTALIVVLFLINLYVNKHCGYEYNNNYSRDTVNNKNIVANSPEKFGANMSFINKSSILGKNNLDKDEIFEDTRSMKFFLSSVEKITILLRSENEQCSEKVKQDIQENNLCGNRADGGQQEVVILVQANQTVEICNDSDKQLIINVYSTVKHNSESK